MKQIYTGYKWRPMTPEEIEIMDATRLRPYKLEEPESGDLYDGPCETDEDEEFYSFLRSLNWKRQ
ncbi:hypothetical protein [Trichococcus collinsii]|uniref:Uncharacterized protein n=1 Tax=Trichococcus collinsii TaxID=157076 RepID=A0AB37ZXR4_9LACT|nr:hypothetical protein [Trichococcus collinsii]CZR03552.1 Hypothetical protein Tcol_2168 [Trichococcus collinsii]SEA00251.1 hypothetical protein SAMN04488525_101838 [Trichococcus collinsii]